jgi:S1-C subfamily serine protease
VTRTFQLTCVLAGALVLGGCGLQANEPPEDEPDLSYPRLVPVSRAVPEAIRVEIPRLAAQSTERGARKLTVRVRNVSCIGVGVGSGFAIDDDLLVTNRHVLAGAEDIQVSTWDGRTLEVSTAEVGVLGDLGLAVVDGKLPRVGRYGSAPQAGAEVIVAGYPLGGELTIGQGTVVDYVRGGPFGIPGRIMRLTARVQPGNSGGPVLARSGRIVGVVFAIELATNYGLAIPVDTLRKLARSGGYEPIPPCGSG